jgi:hypothetical protein
MPIFRIEPPHHGCAGLFQRQRLRLHIATVNCCNCGSIPPL